MVTMLLSSSARIVLSYCGFLALFCAPLHVIESWTILPGAAAARISSGVVGEILSWPTETVPEGFLECNGQTLSCDEYPELFLVLQTTYGTGNQTDSFKIPDFRGYFLRGWDHGAGVDPEAAARKNRGDGTIGDRVGTRQGDEIRRHQHQQRRNLFSTAVHSTGGGTPGADYGGQEYGLTSPTGGLETRPRNTVVMFIIRAKRDLLLSQFPNTFESLTVTTLNSENLCIGEANCIAVSNLITKFDVGAAVETTRADLIASVQSTKADMIARVEAAKTDLIASVKSTKGDMLASVQSTKADMIASVDTQLASVHELLRAAMEQISSLNSRVVELEARCTTLETELMEQATGTSKFNTLPITAALVLGALILAAIFVRSRLHRSQLQRPHIPTARKSGNEGSARPNKEHPI
eukprot:c19012_g1_i1.p1 GENE.c19012_g1_i1~~c19012_g1_i1.p1  ORF type:complete len:409 (-),score=64.03 c19012_g1_i1:167-1393(-)